ncbi:uncharacterized protein SETTUDRAFT_159420 [Exserohilum turcica Et28A]|uniref:F-box protein n=1 Tax=Exserohilum turcicum (strain 28A) TaxID=671987 RepID=R0KA56_EXST2|nr:uncharacterized protein SETTUDRAFT_159420 [Exserohilum turcica Et28A]EOA89863.1 hypothetical protein SETTUDRAFT_159420 [Exserohilum turcica Et28A]
MINRAPEYPMPNCEPVQKVHCPQAAPGQRLLLDGLYTDVLSVIIDWICAEKEASHSYSVTRANHGFRKKGGTLFCLSLVNKRMRSLCISKLFEKVFRYTASMGELNRRLRDIEGNPLLPSLPSVLRAIKVCDIVTTSRGKNTRCRTRLARTLPKMECLTELSITHRKDVDISGLSATFDRKSVCLESVKRLRILSNGSWDFLIRACPNVKTLGLGFNLGHDDIMEAAQDLKHLKHLEICCHAWDVAGINRLRSFVPKIQSLVMRGALDPHQHASDFAIALNHFEHLRDIAITTLCHVSDEDLESQFSDDDSGTDSIIALLEIGVANFEDESLVRDEFYEHWSHMRCLYIVDDKARRQPHEPGEKPFWYPDDETITGEDAVFGVEKLSYDREGFLDLFSFPRPVSYCDEAYDPPFYRPMSRHEREDKEKRRYTSVKIRASHLDLWD